MKKALLFSFLMGLFGLLLASPAFIRSAKETAAATEIVYLPSGTKYTMDGGTIGGRDDSSFYLHGGTLTINGGTITGNTLSNGSYGGAVYCDAGTLTMSGGTITGNTLQNGSYGGAFYCSGSTINMTGGSINNNKAYYGGGIQLQSGSRMTMTKGEIKNNTATFCGGGIEADNSAVFTMNDGTISGNTTLYGGGGVSCMEGGTFNMNGGTISGNKATATEGGGGVFIQAATFNMNGGTITGNTATNGSGVYMQSDGTTGSTFNYTSGTISGEIYINDTSSVLVFKKAPTTTLNLRFGYALTNKAKVAKLDSSVYSWDVIDNLNVANMPADTQLSTEHIDDEEWIVVVKLSFTLTINIVGSPSSMQSRLSIRDVQQNTTKTGSYTLVQSVRFYAEVQISSSPSYFYIYIDGELRLYCTVSSGYNVSQVALSNGQVLKPISDTQPGYYSGEVYEETTITCTCTMVTAMLPNDSWQEGEIEINPPKTEREIAMLQETYCDNKKFVLEPVKEKIA